MHKPSVFLKNIIFASLYISKACFSDIVNRNLIFRQLYEATSSTYTYILGDSETKQCVIIDPVNETVDRDLKLIKELGLNLTYGLNTHMHADHITGTGLIKNKLGSTFRSVISRSSGAKADILLNNGDTITFGKHEILCNSTPGHTNGCMTFILKGGSMAFTGDTLLIRGCGRTDFQEGDASTLYDSVHRVIFSLPDDCLLYPAHDYKGMTVTTVGEEKRYNPRLTKSKPEYIRIMENLNLPEPKKIKESVKANKVCGLYEVVDS